VPLVVFSPQPANTSGLPCSGAYYRPGRYEVAIDGQFHDGRFGILLVGTAWPDEIPSIIAHEWRHHWQLSTGRMPYDGVGWNDPLAATDWDAWEAATRRYFRGSRCELDALAFELQVAPSDVADLRMSLVRQRA